MSILFQSNAPKPMKHRDQFVDKIQSVKAEILEKQAELVKLEKEFDNFMTVREKAEDEMHYRQGTRCRICDVHYKQLCEKYANNPENIPFSDFTCTHISGAKIFFD